MPYVLKKINVPVYGSALSMELVKVKLKEHRINKAKLNIVGPRDQIKLKNMSVEFIRVNHSIPDAYSIAVHTNQGVIYHTGDFKIDLTPIDGEQMDIHRICQISDERSEEHTSELQSRQYLVCRLLLEKKKNKNIQIHT